MKKGIIALIIAVLFVAALALGAQNGQIVSVNILVAELELRLSWLMSGTFLGGFVFACLALFIFYSRSRLQTARLRRRLNKKEQELLKLREQLAGE